MRYDPHTVEEWRQVCHLYFSLARELLYCINEGGLVMSEWTSRSRAMEIRDLLKAASEAVARAPFGSTEGEE